MITWALIASAVIALALVVRVQGKWTSLDSWFAAFFASAPHDRPSFLVGHLVGNRASFLCTKAPLCGVPDELSDHQLISSTIQDRLAADPKKAHPRISTTS